jgi:mRNA interferase MazF
MEAPLTAPSWIMVDKIVTVPRAKIGGRIGSLSSGDVTRLNRALAVFLGIAGG